MFRLIVDRSKAVAVLVLMIIIGGITAYSVLPRESSPEIRRPLIFVTTIYDGVSAGDIETLITEEIEKELDGTTGLDKLTSVSSLGVSHVTAEFTSDIDVETALQRVREKVDVAKAELPTEALEPVVKELNFSDQPIIIITLTHPNGVEVLEESADRLEEDLDGILGVLDVKVSGKLEREVAIELDPARLKHFGLNFDDVRKAVQNENTTIAGGSLRGPLFRFDLAVSGEIEDVTEFENIRVVKDGKSIRLSDLGQVAFKYQDRESIARMNLQPAVTIAVTKRSGENLIRIVDDIKAKVDASVFPKGTKVIFSRDQSDDIRRMVKDLENNILSGLVLVLVITLFFLGPVNALFVSLGIPFSMLVSFIVLQAAGITLNMVVLFSLVLALGMLVDNGIVIVENIYRHRSMGATRRDAAIKGVSEVALPIATSTLTTILAFFPIIFMPDIMGEFMSYIPKTVIIVLTSSLFVGYIITTVFCANFLNVRKGDLQAMTTGSGGFNALLKVYERALQACLSWYPVVVVVSMLFVISGIVVYALLGREPIFFPSIDPKAAIVTVETAPGTSLEVTDVLTKQVEDSVREVPNTLETVQATSGAAGRGTGNASNKAELRLASVPYEDRDIPTLDYIEDLKQLLAGFAGAEIRVQEEADGPPQGHNISYEINGQDYAVMGKIADRVMDIILEYEDSYRDFDNDFEASNPEIQVDVDRERAAYYGLNTRQIAQTVRTAMYGQKVSTYRKGEDEYDVMMRLQESDRSEVASLERVEVVHEGKRIALNSVASVDSAEGVGIIKRNERQRAVSLWADFLPDVENKAEIKQAIQARIDQLELPAGYQVGSGEGEAVRNRATMFLMQAFGVAVFLITLVLVMQFNSILQPIIILVSVILSLGGVMWGLALSGKQFVIIMSGIGVISLAGVVVNNAIVMIDFINSLIRDGQDVRTAIVEGAKTRLRPVLLTAITTIVGLLPMALGVSFDFFEWKLILDSESSAWWSHMAWAIIFGLGFATILTTLAVPVFLYLQLEVLPSAARKSIDLLKSLRKRSASS